MPAAAVVGAAVVGGLITAYSQDRSASKAADASQANANASNRLTRQMYDQSRKDLQPYMEWGQASMKGLGEYMKSVEKEGFKLDENDPIYKWRQSENERQVNQFMASRGGYDSRAAGNMLMQSGMALQGAEVDRQYNQRYLGKFNMLRSAAGLGMQAAAAGAGVNAEAGNQLVGINTTNSTNQQNALLQKGAAWGGLGQNIASAPANYLAMKKLLN